MQSITLTYRKEQWANSNWRQDYIEDARQRAKQIGGKVIIKVKDGRHSTKVFEVAYIEKRNGFIINRRAF